MSSLVPSDKRFLSWNIFMLHLLNENNFQVLNSDPNIVYPGWSKVYLAKVCATLDGMIKKAAKNQENVRQDETISSSTLPSTNNDNTSSSPSPSAEQNHPLEQKTDSTSSSSPASELCSTISDQLFSKEMDDLIDEVFRISSAYSLNDSTYKKSNPGVIGSQLKDRSVSDHSDTGISCSGKTRSTTCSSSHSTENRSSSNESPPTKNLSYASNISSSKLDNKSDRSQVTANLDLLERNRFVNHHNRRRRKGQVAPMCNFCRNNGEPASVYTGHNTKDEYGHVCCPILFGHICVSCGATGVNAHTRSYCPMALIIRDFFPEDVSVQIRYANFAKTARDK